jgi:hypothetical protein
MNNAPDHVKNIGGRSELDHALIALAAARAKTQRMACAKFLRQSATR